MTLAVVSGSLASSSGTGWAPGLLLVAFLLSAAALAIGGRALREGPIDGADRRSRLALCAACLLAGLATLHGGRMQQPWKNVSENDRVLIAWLERNAAPDEPLLPSISPEWTALQPKMGRPILFRWETLYIMGYQPRKAAVVGAMARDLYGVDYADADRMERVCGTGQLHAGCPEWEAAWKGRGLDDWRRLGRKYGFRLLLAPRLLAIDLPPALATRDWTLYRIPEAERTNGNGRHRM